MKYKKIQMSRVTLSTLRSDMERHNISADARCTVKNRKQFKEIFPLILEDEESIKREISQCDKFDV